MASCAKYAADNSVASKATAFELAAKIEKYDATFAADVQRRIDRDNAVKEEQPEEEVDSRYMTENIVAVTYGSAMGQAYKTIILNYNNYSVNIVYNGKEYTIPAYEFVVVD